MTGGGLSGLQVELTGQGLSCDHGLATHQPTCPVPSCGLWGGLGQGWGCRHYPRVTGPWLSVQPTPSSSLALAGLAAPGRGWGGAACGGQTDNPGPPHAAGTIVREKEFPAPTHGHLADPALCVSLRGWAWGHQPAAPPQRAVGGAEPRNPAAPCARRGQNQRSWQPCVTCPVVSGLWCHHARRL